MADLSTSFNPATIASASDAASSALVLGATVSDVASAASSAIAARTGQSVKSAASPTFATTNLKKSGSPDLRMGAYSTTITSAPYLTFLKSHHAIIDTLTQTIDNDVLGILRFYGIDDANSLQYGFQIKAIQNGAAGTGHVPTEVIFETHSAAALNSNQFVLYSDGKVGLGVAVPNAKLEVEGNIRCNETIYFDAVQTATGDGTTTIDWGLGNKFYFTFGAFNETFTFTAPDGPCNVVLVLKQDGTGSRTATWPNTVMWPGGTVPTLTTTAAGVDIVCFFYDGTNYFGQTSLNFSVPA